MTRYTFYARDFDLWSKERYPEAYSAEPSLQDGGIVINSFSETPAKFIVAVTWFEGDCLKTLAGDHDDWWPYLHELASGWENAATVLPKYLHKELLEKYISPFKMGLMT